MCNPSTTEAVIYKVQDKIYSMDFIWAVRSSTRHKTCWETARYTLSNRKSLLVGWRWPDIVLKEGSTMILHESSASISHVIWVRTPWNTAFHVTSQYKKVIAVKEGWSHSNFIIAPEMVHNRSIHLDSRTSSHSAPIANEQSPSLIWTTNTEKTRKNLRACLFFLEHCFSKHVKLRWGI